MPSPLTETAAWDYPGGLPAPIDGDDDAAATFAPGFQGLADRTQFLKSVVDGFLLGACSLTSTDGVHVSVSSIPMLKIGSAISGTAAATNFAPAGLVANAWFYLYGLITAGVLSFEASTTPFDPAAPIWKTGDQSRRYLGCFRADGAAAIIPFRGDGVPGSRRYVYRYDASNAFVTGTDGAGGGAITMNMSAAVPPHARIADLYLTVSTHPAVLSIAGGTGTLGIPVGVATLPFLLDPSQSFVFGGSGGACTLNAFAFSFTE